MNHSVSLPRRRSILLHGWDAQARSWHGPTPVAPRAGHRSLGGLKKIHGAFHVGTFRRSVDNLPEVEFHTAFYDREHAGLAIVDLEGASGGAAALVVVVPDAHHRSRLPVDFAEDLMRLVCLLSGARARVSPANSGEPAAHPLEQAAAPEAQSRPARGSALHIHEYLEQALRSDAASAQVFALELAELEPDVAMVLSTYVVELATSVLDWMAAREARREPLDIPIARALVHTAAAV